MHILFLPSWYPAHPDDALGSFFREQALALQNAGCEVGVIAPTRASLRNPVSAMRKSRAFRVECDAGIPTYRQAVANLTPRIWWASARLYARQSWRLWQAYTSDHGRPDLIHVHAGLLAGAGAVEISRRTGVPFVLSEHSTSFARGVVSKSGLRLARKNSEKAEKRFAVSTPFARLLEDRLSMPEHSWSVMPNMVDQRFLDAPLSNRNDERFRFLHISLLDPKKRVDLIINAFADKFAQNDRVELVIGGDGPTRPALQALAKKNGLSERIKFTGYLSRDEVRFEMTRADSFVLSSQYETFGVVLIEAMAMGLPVVATRCGGPEDIVTRNSGILVPIDDVAVFGAAMQNIWSQRNSWNKQAQRNQCRERFGTAVLSRQWQQEYRRVLTARENA